MFIFVYVNYNYCISIETPKYIYNYSDFCFFNSRSNNIFGLTTFI